MKIPNWCKKLWEAVGSKFQSSYDKIKSWGLPPEVDAIFDEIWKNLSPSLQKALWEFIKNLIEQYGEDAAKKMLTANLRELNRIVE